MLTLEYLFTQLEASSFKQCAAVMMISNDSLHLSPYRRTKKVIALPLVSKDICKN